MSLQGIMLRYFSRKGDKKRDDAIPYPTSIQSHLNLSYGPYNEENILDVYYPKNTTSALPTIVSVHGGGYVYGTKENYRRYCMDLARRGFAVVNFNYRLAPKNRFPAPLEDTNSVMQWICTNASTYHLDKSRLILLGDSAGAQIASQYAAIYSNSEFASLFDFCVPAIHICAIGLNCGMYNMVKVSKPRRGIYLDYLGRQVTAEDPRLNVMDAITEKYPPTYITTSANDFLKENAQPMYEHLSTKGIPAHWKCYGTPEQKDVAHVFHLNIIHPEAVSCNDDACTYFKNWI